jgi:hypothetical protein
MIKMMTHLLCIGNKKKFRRICRELNIAGFFYFKIKYLSVKITTILSAVKEQLYCNVILRQSIHVLASIKYSYVRKVRRYQLGYYKL